LILKQLKRIDSNTLNLVWDNGHSGPVHLAELRDSCPCAGCQGESVLFRTYVPPTADKSAPGRYELRSATPIGNYAMKFSWGDGHAEGIYTWEHLRALCDCEECRGRKELYGRNSGVGRQENS
jgi:DUF971 family protein